MELDNLDEELWLAEENEEEEDEELWCEGEENVLDSAFFEKELRAELLELANEEDYEAYVRRISADRFFEEDSAHDMVLRERFLATAIQCRYPQNFLEQVALDIYGEEEIQQGADCFTNPMIYNEALLDQMMDMAIMKNDAVFLQWLNEHSFHLGDDSQYYFDCAVLQKATSCLKYLLTLDFSWEFSASVAFLLAQNGMGDDSVNDCVALLAEHFLFDENAVFKHSPFDQKPKRVSFEKDVTFASNIPFSILYGLEKFYTGDTKNFRENCFKFYHLSPFMKHCIQYNLLEKTEIDSLIALLERNIYYYLKGVRFSPREITLTLDNRGDETWTKLKFHFPVDPFEKGVEMLDFLLNQNPKLIQRKGVRALVAVLALLDEPHPSMVARVQKMTGKHLVITDYSLPWFTGQEARRETLIGDCLFRNWEKVIPNKLKPAITHSQAVICDIFNEPLVSVTDLLTHCEVLGNPPKNRLSELGESLLQLPCDHPIFLKALEPEGILYKEKEHYLDKLNEDKYKYHSHYLLTISLFKEEKSYAL